MTEPTELDPPDSRDPRNQPDTTDLIDRTAAAIAKSYADWEAGDGCSPSVMDHVYAAERIVGIYAHAMVRDEMADWIEVLQQSCISATPEIECRAIAAYLVGILTDGETCDHSDVVPVRSDGPDARSARFRKVCTICGTDFGPIEVEAAR